MRSNAITRLKIYETAIIYEIDNSEQIRGLFYNIRFLIATQDSKVTASILYPNANNSPYKSARIARIPTAL